MNAADVSAWVDRYIRAWDTNDAAEIGGLFGERAMYYTAPFREPWRGRDAIVAGWLDSKDEPGDHAFRYEVAGIDGDLSIVRGWTTYPEQDPPAYSNLWLIRFDPDGRAREFIEWWMAESG